MFFQWEKLSGEIKLGVLNWENGYCQILSCFFEIFGSLLLFVPFLREMGDVSCIGRIEMTFCSVVRVYTH